MNRDVRELPPADAHIRRQGAAIASRHARSLYVASQKLERAGLTPAAVILITNAIEEAVKAIALALSAHGQPEGERYLQEAIAGHGRRLRVGQQFFLVSEPAFMALILLGGLLGNLLGKDTKMIWSQLGFDNKTSESAFAAFVWRSRQRAMYVDWEAGNWSDPQSTSPEDLILLRRVALRLLRMARASTLNSRAALVAE